MNRSAVVAVVESSQIGEARRLAARLAAEAALETTQAGKLALVVTELATNLVRHAIGGQIVLRVRQEQGRRGVEVLALDTGPGIGNVDRALGDGYSTGGTAGAGLGAVSRLSEDFDIYSLSGLGTALLARVWASPTPGPSRSPATPAPSAPEFLIGAVCLPIASETQCGDAWAAVRQNQRILLAVVDGLGHGPLAAVAAAEAIRIFQHYPERSPGQILEVAHAALRSTCGAVMGVAEIRLDQGALCWAGVGNISGEIRLGEASSHLVSHNGTLGHQLRKVQEFIYPWHVGSLLLLHSDGMATVRQPERYPGLWGRDPSLVAGVLYRDFRRGKDDFTVVALRQAITTLRAGQ
jgi:anti-sigma regulatory factor (Ser/Thr protein kinase)